MSSTARICQARRSDGQPCQAWACKDSDLCFWHDPAQATERKAARSKGGRARHGRTLAPFDNAGPVTISNVADVVALLTQTVNDVLRLENSIQRARAIGYLAWTIIKALELADLEERVSALETALQPDSKR